MGSKSGSGSARGSSGGSGRTVPPPERDYRSLSASIESSTKGRGTPIGEEFFGKFVVGNTYRSDRNAPDGWRAVRSPGRYESTGPDGSKLIVDLNTDSSHRMSGALSMGKSYMVRGSYEVRDPAGKTRGGGTFYSISTGSEMTFESGKQTLLNKAKKVFGIQNATTRGLGN